MTYYANWHVAKAKTLLSALHDEFERRFSHFLATFRASIGKCHSQHCAPINVNPVGGSAGKGWGFDKF